MAFNDRMQYEHDQIHPTEFLMQNCFQCRNWSHFVKRDYSYCHKCVNNLRIPIRRGKGFSIAGLYDYYSVSDIYPSYQRQGARNAYSTVSG